MQLYQSTLACVPTRTLLYPSLCWNDAETEYTVETAYMRVTVTLTTPRCVTLTTPRYVIMTTPSTWAKLRKGEASFQGKDVVHQRGRNPSFAGSGSGHVLAVHRSFYLVEQTEFQLQRVF